MVRRTVQREGRSRAWVNGALATAAQLAQATRGLLDISGQHEHVGLLDAQTHLALLDAYAGLSLRDYETAFVQLAEAERVLRGIVTFLAACLFFPTLIHR